MCLRKPRLNMIIKYAEQGRGAIERQGTPERPSLPSLLQNGVKTDRRLDLKFLLGKRRHKLRVEILVFIGVDQINGLVCQPVWRMNHLHWMGASPLQIDKTLDVPMVIDKNVGLI